MASGRAYFDNAASTKVAPEVLDAMMPYMTEEYGNPGGLHWLGDSAAKAMRMSRENTAKVLGCRPSEIFFTSGGTESDNIAIMGSVPEDGHIAISSIEHSAITETCMHLAGRGYEIAFADVENDGVIDPDMFRKIMTDDISLVSVMTANNVIGTIQPIKEIADIAHEYGALFHTDAVQAFTKTDIDVKRMGIDLLSISGHKIHGPKGIGALYVGENVKLKPLMFGGGQESGLRPSTENVPGAVGLGAAAELARKNMDSDMQRMTRIRNKIIDGVLNIPGSALNGSLEERLCSNAHFRFSGIRGMDLVLRLSRAGIAASTASACSAGSADPSHVLTAIGLNAAQALSALRISLSRYNTEEEADMLCETLPTIVSGLRK